jgi:hypothetical protein
MRRIATALLALGLLASCSSEPEEPGRGSPAPAPTGTQSPRDAGPGDQGKGEDRAGKKRRPHRRGHGHHRRGDRSSNAGAPDVALGESAGEDDHSSAVYPAAGVYAYEQRGSERFCQAGSCSRQSLPPREDVRVSLRSAGEHGAVVVSESGSSGDRVLRTTVEFSREGALVTDVYSRLVYRGFPFENSYHPDPPVLALRLPLEEGDSWSGSWRDSTSGTYSMSVLGTEAIQIGGASVGTVKVSSVMTFTGEFEGEAKTLTWVDPATKATVKTSGSLDMTSAYGRYEMDFSNRLRSGPGYR